MGHVSPPRFLTLHALRIKGFAKTGVLAELTALAEQQVEEHLAALAAAGHALYREPRQLWQLTPDGKAVHADELRADMEACGGAAQLAERYHDFLRRNDQFKQLCGDWQLRDGVPNDHADAGYDRDVVARLTALHAETLPIVAGIGERIVRMQPYAPRLDDVCRRVEGGETNMFTGVMCGSYHDVWMELHEDLILSQGIDRAAEGSF
jgi:hypothetical protein